MPTPTRSAQSTESPTAASQQQIGHYLVTARIGRGGMGEVWRATDTKLGREVAIKLLPRVFAGDPIRLARFKREAQLLAALNHPGIAAIYGIEENTENGAPALVMELVEGPTLADRIHAGAIPVDEALPILRQIAEALEFAHERGIVHRDLKPANIKLTPEGQVKVLDFGLAKAMGPDEASADISNSPTLSLAMTEAGLLLGTAAYMAPEQAKAKPVDRRADIWAFGCVAYEMLAGRKAFDGETVSDVLAGIIKGEPEWSALPKTTPLSMQRLLRRCLQKDVRQRLQAIGDARIAIDETLSGAAAEADAAVSAGRQPEAKSKTPLRRALPWALGAIAVFFTDYAAWLALKPAPQQDVIRFAVAPTENMLLPYGGEMSLSPDGRSLVFLGAAPSAPGTLWVRPLDSLTAHQLPGTEGAFLPFWSPDSQEIGFEAGGKLEKIAVSGGTPQALCDLKGFSGATWSRDGVILFARGGSLYRVPDTGGEPALVLAPDPARQEVDLVDPQFLLDGRHFLFEGYVGLAQQYSLAVGSLDSKQVVDLGPIGSDALYAPPGYIFYLDQNALMARPFNARALRFTGAALPVAPSVARLSGSTNYGYFSVSAAGVLAYQPSAGGGDNEMTWFSRAGQKLGTAGQPGRYSNPALSADGSRLAVGVGVTGKRNLWVYDLKRGTASRLTFGSADDYLDPVWTGDDSRIFFSADRGGHRDIYEKAANGLGSEEPVFQSAGQQKAINDLSSDGRYAIYDTSSAGDNELWVLPLLGDRKPVAFVQGGFSARSARFSPNGRFVAYSSTETGEPEIYVRTFPQQTGKWQISPSGGTEPMWRRDGKELFYFTPDNQLMVVPVSTDAGSFQAGIPKPLFQPHLVSFSTWRNIYVPSPDGQRFLMLTPAGEAKPEPITVVVNWPALLRQRGGK
jgi:eukaryotic-like serine/threonine-protein kinase